MLLTMKRKIYLGAAQTILDAFIIKMTCYLNVTYLSYVRMLQLLENDVLFICGRDN